MKNILTRTLAIILALATVFGASLSANAYAENITIEAVGSFDEETGVFTVTENIPNLRNQKFTGWFGIRNSIKSVVIENGVISIGSYAFAGCSYIESISLPVTLESIGNRAFASVGINHSEKLIIDLPGSLKSIGNGAFSNCNIKNLTIPARVSYVDQLAFGGCGIENLEILNSNTLINDFAFSNCKELKTIKIPDGVSINRSAFSNCYNIETVYYTGGQESYDMMEIHSNSNTNISWATVYCNQPATPYPVAISIGSMPEKTTYEVGEELDLTGFELALEMSDGTTQSFSDLSKMYIHNFYSYEKRNGYINVEYYGYKEYIPYTVTQDPNGTCGSNLKWVFDDESGTLTISGCGKMVAYSSRKPAPWNNYRTFIKSVNIGESVESIGTNAFYECEGISEIQLPLSIQSIGSDAFKNSGIKTIYYSGTTEDWSKISATKNQFREMNLYFNGELHEHSFTNDETARESTCRISGTLRHSCECGDFNSEPIPTLPHTPGEWETLVSGKIIKKCTVCSMILDVREETTEKEPAENDEPEELPKEETQEPESEEIFNEDSAEENGIGKIITDVFEKIAEVFENIFGFITKLFSK